MDIGRNINCEETTVSMLSETTIGEQDNGKRYDQVSFSKGAWYMYVGQIGISSNEPHLCTRQSDM